MRRVPVVLCIGASFFALNAFPANAGTHRSAFAPPSVRLTPPDEAAASPLLTPPSLFGSGLFAQRVIEEDEEEKRKAAAQREQKPLRKKNPWVAMALGAAVPGAGHVYVKGPGLTSFLYAGAEVASWLLKYTWNKDGNDKIDEYEDYAWRGDLKYTPDDEYEWTPDPDEGHWSWTRWRTQRGLPGGCQEGMPWDEADSLLVHFWHDNRHEFFEDIGKYDRYDCGWMQASFRTTYVSMRDEANDLLGRARTMSQVILLNHLASGIHAFFVAKGHNRQVQPATQIDWDIRPDADGGMRAQLLVRRRF